VERDWNARFADYAARYPDLAAEFVRRSAGDLPQSFDRVAADFVAQQSAKAESIATRKASQQAIEAFARALPEMLGGAADLTGSVFTNWSGSVPVRAEAPSAAVGNSAVGNSVGSGGVGNYVNYGVREFGMAAIASGVALHGGFIPYAGTFLTFSDYMRNAIRMAAMMRIRSILVFTHDSIGLGEDGPTHQSIEHTASLRLIPGLDVWRPCDAAETAVAWRCALLRRDGPTALVLTRQNVAATARSTDALASIVRGGYVVADFDGSGHRAVVIATGSEVPLALAARAALAAEDIDVRVVSMPCTQAFDRQDAAYRAAVLPAGTPRVAVEAGATGGWYRYVGAADSATAAVIGIDRFGESAPAGVLFKHFGFTAEHVADAVRRVVGAPSRA
ncbi:MAG TPA: transketolase C-terminal domain-containing protein, partial [Casimicrobiaceae bacterium]